MLTIHHKVVLKNPREKKEAEALKTVIDLWVN